MLGLRKRDTVREKVAWVDSKGSIKQIDIRSTRLQIKFGIVYAYEDKVCEDIGLLYVGVTLPFADVKKKIEKWRNLAPDAYSLQYRFRSNDSEEVDNGYWARLKNQKDWEACLGGHMGRQYIELRGLILSPGQGQGEGSSKGKAS